MRIPFPIFAVLLIATTGCNFSDSTNPIPVPNGVVIEIYEVAAAQGNNTKPATDPASGVAIHLLTPPVIATTDVATIAQEENTDQPDHPMLKIDLTPAGGQKMLSATSNPTASSLALVINGKVITVPRIMVPIQDSMVVTGDKNDPNFQMARKIFSGGK